MQVPARVSVLAIVSQRGSRQTVPSRYFWQPPWPSQRPSLPQLAGPWSRQALAGSFSPRAARWSMAPARTGRQRPRASGLAQNVQGPVQALSQQTPSTQNFEAHWSLLVQSCPAPLGPQLPVTQLAGAMQSSALVQLLRQVPSSQVEGAQVIAEPCTQAPSPSHRPAGMN
jgi:hypothetical protein